MEAQLQRPQRFRLFRRRAEERSLTRDNVPAVMLNSNLSGYPISQRTALQIVDVLTCVRVHSEAAAMLPLPAYRQTDTGRVRYEGRIAELLRRPAPGTTTGNLIGQLVGSLAMTGNAYLGKFVGEDGTIQQLGVLPPDRVQPEIKGGERRFTITNNDGRQTIHDIHDVNHMRMPLSIDQLTGVSPIGMAPEALGLASALERHASALFANGAAPRGVLSVPSGPTQDDVMENLRKSWAERHQGAERAGTVAVLSQEVTFTALALNAVDLQFLEQRKLSTQEICRLFRVPPSLVGADSGSSLTYTNSELEALNFVKFSLGPYLTTIEQAITEDRDLCPGPNIYVEFLLDALLRADSKTRAEVYTAALDPITGWLRRDEVRRLENLEAESSQRESVVPSSNGHGELANVEAA